LTSPEKISSERSEERSDLGLRGTAVFVSLFPIGVK